MNPQSLRAWRVDRGLTRQEAAPLLGISERTLQELEYGRHPASLLWGPIERIVFLLDEQKP